MENKAQNKQEKSKKEIRFDHKKLQERTVNEAFRLELRNRFEIFEDLQEPESLWQGFRESVHDFGKKKLSDKGGRKKEWTLIEERDILKKEMEQSQRTRQSTEKYKKKARQVKNGARKDKNE